MIESPLGVSKHPHRSVSASAFVYSSGLIERLTPAPEPLSVVSLSGYTVSLLDSTPLSSYTDPLTAVVEVSLLSATSSSPTPIAVLLTQSEIVT